MRRIRPVPEDYRRLVKDIAIQAVRNAVVHGIERRAERPAAGKPAQGVVRVDFKRTGDGGYKLSVEDDGQGLATERIKEVGRAEGIHHGGSGGDLGCEADIRTAVPARILDLGECHEGCGTRRRA